MTAILKGPENVIEQEITRQRYSLKNSETEASLNKIRSTIKLLPSRKERIYYSLMSTKFDRVINDLLRDSKLEFDNKNFEKSEWYYWQCLEHYPYNPHFSLHYAMCLYNQNKFIDAETYFRNAVALGIEVDVVEPYLRLIFYHERAEYRFVATSRIDPALSKPCHLISNSQGDAWLYPDLVGIRTLGRVFLGVSKISIQLTRQIQRSSRTLWDAVPFIINTDDFRTSNLDLIYVIGKKYSTVAKQLAETRGA